MPITFTNQLLLLSAVVGCLEQYVVMRSVFINEDNNEALEPFRKQPAMPLLTTKGYILKN